MPRLLHLQPLPRAIVGSSGVAPKTSSKPPHSFHSHSPQRALPRRWVVPRAFLPHGLVDPSTLLSLLDIPGMCFSDECQKRADEAFVLAITIPLGVALAAIAFLLRPPPKGEEASKQGIFEDDETGVVFQAPDPQMVPERDKNGELVFKVISYSPFPVDPTTPGERIRIDVGDLQELGPRTFVFEPLFPRSQFVVCSLPKPLGIEFQEDRRRKRAVVAGFVEGGNAEKRVKVAKLNNTLQASTPMVGDVLRATTATNLVYPTESLFGAKPPRRHRVVYGCDRQSFVNIMGSILKGRAEDGDITLVLERRLTPSGEPAETRDWLAATTGSSMDSQDDEDSMEADDREEEARAVGGAPAPGVQRVSPSRLVGEQQQQQEQPGPRGPESSRA